MKVLAGVALAVFSLAPARTSAGEKAKEASDRLVAEHESASGRFSFKTPAGWTVETRLGQPEKVEARGDNLVFRVLRTEGEVGLDSLHVQCMVERLAPIMEAQPQVDYEHDFQEGWVGSRHALDSAFVVHYDEPVQGARDWYQHNVTVVGEGESMCIIGMSPRDLWKKSKETRTLLDAVMASVRPK
jgi:hypothetical protein